MSYRITEGTNPLTYACLTRAYAKRGTTVVGGSSLGALRLTERQVDLVEMTLAHRKEEGVSIELEIDKWLAGKSSLLAFPSSLALEIEPGKDARADLGYLLYGTEEGDI